MARKLRLFNPAGVGADRFVEVSPAEATTLLRQGFQLTQGTKLNLKNEWGEPYVASDTEIYEGIRKGHRIETEAEEHQRYLDENYGGAGAAAAAFAFNAADSATFGAASALGRATGYRETLADLTEAQPGAAIAGQLTGAVAPALLTGGVGGVGALARATPAGAMALRTERTAASLARAFSKAGELDKAAVALGRMGAQAVEGAAFGGAAAMSENLLGDPNLTASKLLLETARGAAVGAAVDGVIGFGFGRLEGRALERSVKKVDGALGGTAAKFTKAQRQILEEIHGRPFTYAEGGKVEKALNTWIANASMKASGKTDPKTRENMVRLATDHLYRQLSEITGAAPKFAEDVTGKWQKVHEQTQKFIHGFDGAEGKIGLNMRERMGRLSEKVPTISDADALEAVHGTFRGVRKIFNEVSEQLLLRPDDAAKTIGAGLSDITAKNGLLERAAKEYLENAAAVGTGKHGPEAFKSLDATLSELTRDVNRLKKTQAWSIVPERLRSQVDEAVDVLVRGKLYDTQVFGDAATGAAHLRQAAAKVMSHEPVYKRFFTQVKESVDRVRVRSSSNVYALDASKVKTFARRLAEGKEVDVHVRGIREMLTDQQRELELILEHVNLEPAERKLAETLQAQWKSLEDRMVVWEETLAAADVRSAIGNLRGGTSFNAYQGAAATANIGKLVAGALGIGGAISPSASLGMYLAGSAVGMLSQPTNMLTRLSQLHSMSERVSGRLNKAAKSVAKKPVVDGRGRISRTASIASAQAAGRSDRESRIKRQADFERLIRNLSSITSEPGAARAELEKQVPPDLKKVAPKIVAAMAEKRVMGAQYVLKEAQKLGLDPRRKAINPAKWAQLQAVVRAVNDPMGEVIEPSMDGYVSRAGVKALKEVHPELFAQWTQAIWDAIDTNVIHGPQARRLSVALDVPFDDFASPENVRMLMNTRAVMAPDAGGQGGSGRPPGPSGRNYAADNSLTPSQRLIG